LRPICFPTKETAIFTVEFLKTIRINSCGFDVDSANALIELQSSKNITGAKVCKDRRMTLRLIIITSFLRKITVASISRWLLEVMAAQTGA
jgi:hypothetical protein